MIVLDTHAWVWFVSNPELLSKPAKKAINAAMAQKEIFISSISAWEVALLVDKKRLELTLDITDWIAKTEKLQFFNSFPLIIQWQSSRSTCLNPSTVIRQTVS